MNGEYSTSANGLPCLPEPELWTAVGTQYCLLLHRSSWWLPVERKKVVFMHTYVNHAHEAVAIEVTHATQQIRRRSTSVALLQLLTFDRHVRRVRCCLRSPLDLLSFVHHASHQQAALLCMHLHACIPQNIYFCRREGRKHVCTDTQTT